MENTISSSPVLTEARAVQDTARELLDMRDRGLDETPEFLSRLADWMTARKAIAATPLSAPVDALVVVHGMKAAGEALLECRDNPASVTLLSNELLTAAETLIRYLEQVSSTTREQLGLFDGYRAPVMN